MHYTKMKYGQIALSTLRPINTSGRTKAQIVTEKELELYSFIIGPGSEHSGECRCQECWHKKLDAVVRAGEEALA